MDINMVFLERFENIVKSNKKFMIKVTDVGKNF